MLFNVLFLANHGDKPDEVMLFPASGVTTEAQISDATDLADYAASKGYHEGEGVDFWVFTAVNVRDVSTLRDTSSPGRYNTPGAVEALRERRS